MSLSLQVPMPSKLYVSNLSQEATLGSMRALFGTCGDVLDVEFAAERGNRSRPSAAFVTMANVVDADRAVKNLHGRLHGDRVLVISRVSGDADGASGPGRAARAPAAEVPVAISQQYRDRHALTYELSCSKRLLTLRFVFPPDDAHDWQVEARLLPGPPSPVLAQGMTRERAFRALVDAWGADTEAASSDVSWEQVATALRAVRAL